MSDPPRDTASRRGLGSEAFGGQAVGSRVGLPADAREPIRVYVNGVEQVRGEDYELEGGQVVFAEPIHKEQLRRLGLIRKLGLGLGLFGWYERNEVVDVEYRAGGETRLISNAPVIPDEA